MMLPPEHIRARRRRGTIRLLYASEEHAGLAETLIAVHHDHRGKTKEALCEALADCEMLGYDFKLVRGLSAVLEERCVFESLAAMDPWKARRAVFQEAGRRTVSTEDERRRVMANAAFKLGVSTKNLEDSLYADLDSEQTLTEFRGVEPMDLLKEYNFALTVGLLAHAGRLELAYPGADEGLEKLCGRLGRCEASKTTGGSRLVAQWRATSRIGYKAAHLESVMARLSSKEGWEVSADVFYPHRSHRPHRFEISAGVHGKMMKPGEAEKGLLVGRKTSRMPVAPRPRGEVVDVADVARRMMLTEEEVRGMYEGYMEIGGVLITREKRDEILAALEGAPDMRFGPVRLLLRGLGVRSPVPVLQALGYDVEWNRDRDESVVYRLRPPKRKT